MFYYIVMYKHFGYIGEKKISFLSHDFAKCRPYVTLFDMFHFLSGYAMRILILIRRRGIEA